MAIGFNFGRLVLLWLAILIPIFIMSHFYFLKRNQNKAMRFANFEALKRIAGERLVTKNIIIFITRLLVLIAMIFVMTQATFYYDGTRNDYDYVLAIDTSSSMTSTDIPPTRIAAARDAGLIFLETLDTDAKLGLVTFAGVTYVRSGLTDEKVGLRLKIASLNISRISGTDISGAIITATNLFSDTSDRGKAILLITDGVDTVGGYLDSNIEEAVRYAKQEQVVIFPVGLGTQNAPIGYLPLDYNLTSSIDESSLLYMANMTGGEAAFPKTSEELISYFEEFNTKSHSGKIIIPLHRYSLIFAFIMLILEWAVFNLFFRRVA